MDKILFVITIIGLFALTIWTIYQECKMDDDDDDDDDDEF
jgi:hypothetical protein